MSQLAYITSCEWEIIGGGSTILPLMTCRMSKLWQKLCFSHYSFYFFYFLFFNLNLTEQTGRLAYKTWLRVSLDDEVV